MIRRCWRRSSAFFDLCEGRPSIPMETYLRLMFLKYRFGLGYERLCALVADTLSWRRFCRIGLEGSVPDESTIRKITRRCGPELVEVLNEVLLARAAGRGEIDLGKVRADTTVVEADVRYPTDSGLLCHAVCRIAKLLARLAADNIQVSYVDRSVQARAAQHSIGAWLRRRTDQAKSEVLKITGDLADLADASISEALVVLAQGLPAGRAVSELDVLCARASRVVAQARSRVAGEQPDGATRIVSLHEPDARPIRKGRLGKPVEFGYKVQVLDNADGIVLDHSVHIGNPHDAILLVPAIERIINRSDRAPGLVTVDRGYWQPTIEDDLAGFGVSEVVIPRIGKPSRARAEIEHGDAFVAGVKWRTGSEGLVCV